MEAMKRIAVLCAVMAIALCLAPAEPAHAGLREVLEDLQNQQSKENEEAWREFSETADSAGLIAEAEKIAVRVESLPDNVDEGNRSEVERLRRDCDSLRQKLSDCSYSRQRRAENAAMPDLLGLIWVETGHGGAAEKLSSAESALWSLSQKGSEEEAKAERKSNASAQSLIEQVPAEFRAWLPIAGSPGTP